ncbi:MULTISPECIES: type II secretion system protein GspC [Tenebrionibacter/Tenebrionicola group]|jgi:general secretion pathway protein C|uniref:Type II secretion system protein GspC n=2 Tax=Tenebrionibacter/Tenebrionicola group TaxID=2969848 RepID=A0A8K0V5G0_9ENTR|nr:MULTISPECIES: type II secretion system protein GspC [Tenebrionibacter/Tenebrionicola group]MBK4716106.1 type II secretion system protein GspC [Tenebrionibacter intestinalis]MBV5095965.1 type II secretion system protein GspC [Tenebrionicola larvae]
MKQAVFVALIARIIFWGFTTLAAGLLALITWQLAAPVSPFRFTHSSFVSNQRSLPPRFARGLFGAGAQDDAPAAAGLPDTALPLTLTGLIASDDARRRLAVLRYQGRQASYREGDTLPVKGVRVRSINARHVILDEPGGPKRLGWPRQATLASADARVAREVREQLTQRPQDIADFLSVAPVREKDAMRGYRINPGRKPELFKSLGFEPDDLAVAINGIDLTDDQQARRVLQQLAQLRALTVTVERDGQRHDISVSLDEKAL